MNAMLKVSNYPKWLCAEDTNKGTRTEEQELTNYWAYVDTKKNLERHCSWMMWGPSIMQVEACNSKIWVFMIYKVHAMKIHYNLDFLPIMISFFELGRL